MRPIGYVVGGRKEPIDDLWGEVEATIEVDEARINLGARHPRNREDWPLVGIFAQRAKARPNRIGVSTSELLGVVGLTIRVRGLDAIDGTPVLDVKPHVREFDPRTPIEQPQWITDLMTEYWT
jgi:tRNA (adenine37-N6)-methyltransferase